MRNDPITVACPFCGAKPGTHCVSRDGMTASAHMQRWAEEYGVKSQAYVLALRAKDKMGPRFNAFGSQSEATQAIGRTVASEIPELLGAMMFIAYRSPEVLDLLESANADADLPFKVQLRSAIWKVATDYLLEEIDQLIARCAA